MSPYPTVEAIAPVIERWLASLASDPEVARLSQHLAATIDFGISDLNFTFHTWFQRGRAGGGLTPAGPSANVRLSLSSDVFDQMMSRQLDGAMAVTSGQLSFTGDMGAAMGLAVLQPELERLYLEAKQAAA
jgi:hypothetical protein